MESSKIDPEKEALLWDDSSETTETQEQDQYVFEKSDARSSTDTLLDSEQEPDFMSLDVEKQGYGAETAQVVIRSPTKASWSLTLWMITNTIATVAIVS